MKGISLSSVIQVINLERQSCDIEARVDSQRGQLHFRDGALVDALADGLAGEDAAYEILAWDDPEFEVNTGDSPRDRMIEADLTQMLLEIARRQDEEKEEAARSAVSEESFPPALEPLSPLPLAESAPATPTAASTAAPTAASAVLNAAGLKRVVQIAKDGIGDALLSADLFSSGDGTSYVGVNSQPAVCALVNQVTERMTWAFDKGGLPPLGRYYTAELTDSRMLLVAPCGGLQLSLVVDTSRVQLGLLLNVVLPEVLAALEEVSPR